MNCKLCRSKTELFGISREVNCKNYNLYRCRVCEAYYSESQNYEYETNQIDLINFYEQNKNYIVRRHQKIIEFVSKKFGVGQKRFLDIGSGIGYSLFVSKQFGWDALGIEPNSKLAEYSSNKLSLNVINGYLNEDTSKIIKSHYPEGADYILVDNVLEHIDDPLKFLAEVLKHINPKGVLLVIVPPVDWLRLLLSSIKYIRNNSQSPQLNLFYDPEQHVNYFSRAAISNLVATIGGYELSRHTFHHSILLNGFFARIFGFETGYYLITKELAL